MYKVLQTRTSLKYDNAMVTHQSMYGYLKDNIGDNTDACKLVYFGRKISAQELLKTIDEVAAYLLKAGIQRGDVVGIALPNIPEAVFALYAVNAVGGVANLIHPKISESAFCNLIQKTNTKLIFLYDKLYKKYGDCLQNLTTVICSVSEYMPYPYKMLFALTEPSVRNNTKKFSNILGASTVKLTPCGPAEPAIYIHSGGTMGEPKTVVLTSEALNRLAEAMVSGVYVTGEPLREDDVMLMMLPLFHGFGLGVCVHTALSRIQTVLLPRFKAKLANKVIKKYGVTHLAGVPAMFAKMLREKNFAGKHLQKITRIFCGGDRLDPKVKKEFDTVLQSFRSPAELTEGYGLSEASAVFSVSLTGETRAGCQGRPLPGNRIKVMDERGEEVAQGETGEFYISSPSLMTHYLDDPEGTKAVMTKDDRGNLWLKTGDMGFLEQDGGIHFLERRKRSLKIAAVNIFPSEIEKVVCTLPEVKECCVIRARYKGKPCTKLLLVLNEKARLDAALEKKIRTYICEKLIKYAVPKEIIAVDKLARTSFGKIDFRYYEKQDGIR